MGAAHFVLVPLMAQGHMAPMVHFARLLLTSRSKPNGNTVTLVTTPINADRFRRSFHSLPLLNVVELPFPCEEAGLPSGCENLNLVPSLSLMPNFFHAISLLGDTLEDRVRSLDPPPSCIVSDMGLPWTSDVAHNLGIPRFTFYCTCCFSLLSSTTIRRSGVLDTLSDDDDEPFEIPGLHHRITIKRSQLPDNFGSAKKTLKATVDKVREAERSAEGVIVNSFYGLEKGYVELYEEALSGTKVWTVGPVSISEPNEAKEEEEEEEEEGVWSSTSKRWLDSMSPGSVLYVGFGSLTQQTPEQLIEIASGLERSGYPFVWAIKSGERGYEFEKWLQDQRFEERNGGKGMLIRGWAPQMAILSHPAVGGFLTHCGWNSTIEGVAAGLPMATWPLFAEQFLNERLLVDVLEVGVPVGIAEPTKWRLEEQTGVVAGRDQVERAVRELMGGSRLAQARRSKARELAGEAKRALEDGGTSRANLTHFVEHVITRGSSADY